MMEDKGYKPPMPTRVSEPLEDDPQYILATFSGRREGGEFARIWNEWKVGERQYNATKAVCRD
jgi:hypothetical protein